jgi:hypothetical protein
MYKIKKNKHKFPSLEQDSGKSIVDDIINHLKKKLKEEYGKKVLL